MYVYNINVNYITQITPQVKQQAIRKYKEELRSKV